MHKQKTQLLQSTAIGFAITFFALALGPIGVHTWIAFIVSTPVMVLTYAIRPRSAQGGFVLLYAQMLLIGAIFYNPLVFIGLRIRAWLSKQR